MLDIDKHQSYSSHLLSSGEGASHLQTKLGLYQVFIRIYEQNKDLLNEILELEYSGQQVISPVASSFYVQGVVVAGAVYIVTNLIGGKTQAVLQPDAQWTIGRDRGKSSLALAEPRLSRCHACIAYDFDKQQFHLSDLGSTNGTFINSEQIFHRQYLGDGDRIRLGSLSFTFFTYQILPQSSPSSQAVAPEDGGCSGLVTLENRIYPSGQSKQQVAEPNVPEDTMMVPNPIRPA
ncbi:MAG: FHA domain-containing protein [Cyanobacteria bacterium P01_F01_bin.150]